MRDTRPLTHETALSDLRAILYAAQKARSVVAETGLSDDPVGASVAAQLQPWLFGPRSIVLPLSRLIERCERTGRVNAGDYTNFLRIAHSERAIGIGVLAQRHFELRELDVPGAIRALGTGLEEELGLTDDTSDADSVDSDSVGPTTGV